MIVRISVALMFSCCVCAYAEAISSAKENFTVETVAEGLSNPWGLVKLPDGRLLVTERRGTLRIIQDGQILPEPVSGTPQVLAKGQGGLLDIELHPDYAKNGWIYLSYSEPLDDQKSLTVIARGRLNGTEWTDNEVVFRAPPEEYTAAGAHFGSRLEFDKDRNLFFSIGERGDMSNAQKLDNVKGKIHRIRDDGSIPPDNPFPGERSATIWTYGHRNPQGLRFDPKSGDLWETEHGPRGGDELNIIHKGLNYGWPVITYGINYNGTPISDKTEAPGMEQPVLQWTPSIAVCGIDFYEGDAFPRWKGNLFAAALAHQKLVRVEIGPDKKVVSQEILLEKTGRIRDVRCLDDGYIYLVYDQPGRIVRLVPTKS